MQHRVPVQDIAILTPYSAQKAKLHKMVKDLPAEFHELKVASVTESQGMVFSACYPYRIDPIWWPAE